MIPDNVKQIMSKLEANKHKAYIIGGAVRDILSCKEPHDYDIFTDANGEQILRLFPQGKVIGGEERQAKILTVVVDGVEVSQFRSNGTRTETGHSLEEHQATCDFTINSIAMDINEDIIDTNNGVNDIYNMTLRFVGDAKDRIKEDPLRILRAIRFMDRFEFKDNSSDKISLFKNKHLINELPKERIKDELMKILKDDKSIYRLIKYDILYDLIPELEKVKCLDGGENHNENVDTHMRNAFRNSCTITDNILLRFAIFMHDIGKGYTYESTVDGTHFYEHENKGEAIVCNIMDRLKFSRDEIKYVATLVRLHMYSYKSEPSKRSYIRFFNKLEEANIPIEDYIMLIYCDHQANMSHPRIKFGDFIKGNWLYKKYYEIKYSEEPMTVKDLKVNGHDVMKYGISGKEVGDVLNYLFELVMDGIIPNERAALLFKLGEKMNGTGN